MEGLGRIDDDLIGSRLDSSQELLLVQALYIFQSKCFDHLVLWLVTFGFSAAIPDPTRIDSWVSDSALV